MDLNLTTCTLNLKSLADIIISALSIPLNTITDFYVIINKKSINLMPKKSIERLKELLREYKTFIRNTSWTALNQIVVVVLSVTSVIFARSHLKSYMVTITFSPP